VSAPMNRRKLLFAAARLGASAAGLALLGGCSSPPARETRPARVPRVGVLLGSSGPDPYYDAFRESMRELGWIEGQNVRYEVRSTRTSSEGNADAIPAQTAALVNLPVDVIHTSGSIAALAAQRATSTIPIVMAGVQDPVALGLVASLGRSGGNVTGLSRLTIQLGAKRLELLKEVVPGLARVAYFWESSPAGALGLADIQAPAQALGLQVQALEVKMVDEFEAAFAAASRERAEAFLTNGALFRQQRVRLAELAARTRLPSIHADRSYAEAGLLMSYGEDLFDLQRRSATYVDKILRGANPAELPVEQPSKFELVVNLKTAQALGVTIPPSLAGQVTEWIR